MTDSTFGFKSSKKEKKASEKKASPEAVKNFTGSLALRVFLISFVCLVLPLIAYCFMMYRYDFDLKQSQRARTLELVSDMQVFVINQLMNFEFQTLEQTALYLRAYADPTPDEHIQMTQALARIVKLGHLEGVVVLKKDVNNDALCTLSSSKCIVGHAYNTLFFTPALKENDYTILVEQQEHTIWFVKVLQRGPQREVLETLNLVISTPFLLRYLTEAQGYHDVYQVFLFNQDSMILDGQDSTLIHKKVVIDPSHDTSLADQMVLRSVPMEPHTYEYVVGKKKRYATIVPLADFHLNLLITQVEEKEKYYLREFFYQTILLFVSILVLGGLGAWFFTYLMAKPLKRLCLVMTKVSNHDLTTRYESCAYGFEINKVGEVFNTMIQNLLYHLHQLQEKTIQQEILQQELHIGHQIQKSLVPTQIPEVPGIEIQTVLIPTKEVAGDFYDFFVNPNNSDEVILVMADTSGHGVFGCFYALTMRSILRSLGSTISELREMIVKANQLFCKDSASSNVFVTTWIGSYNHTTHELRYSSCGHPLGFVFREEQLLQELTTPGIAMGVVEDMDPVIASVNLQPGDTLVLITDGLIETRNPQGQLYGKTRFIESVETHCHLEIADLTEHVVHDMESFEVEPDNQEDDVTMVVIRIR